MRTDRAKFVARRVPAAQPQSGRLPQERVSASFPVAEVAVVAEPCRPGGRARPCYSADEHAGRLRGRRQATRYDQYYWSRRVPRSGRKQRRQNSDEADERGRGHWPKRGANPPPSKAACLLSQWRHPRRAVGSLPSSPEAVSTRRYWHHHTRHPDGQVGVRARLPPRAAASPTAPRVQPWTAVRRARYGVWQRHRTRCGAGPRWSASSGTKPVSPPPPWGWRAGGQVPRCVHP